MGGGGGAEGWGRQAVVIPVCCATGPRDIKQVPITSSINP